MKLKKQVGSILDMAIQTYRSHAAIYFNFAPDGDLLGKSMALIFYFCIGKIDFCLSPFIHFGVTQ